MLQGRKAPEDDVHYRHLLPGLKTDRIAHCMGSLVA
jgi:hypothetical protein